MPEILTCRNGERTPERTGGRPPRPNDSQFTESDRMGANAVPVRLRMM